MTQIITNLKQHKNTIAWAVTILLMLIHLWVANLYIVNIPYWDDYDLALGFLNQYLSTEGFWNKLSLLFSQDNEHRIVTQRLLFVLDYALFGELDLTHIMRFGNCFWLLLWYFFFRLSNLSVFHFLPVSFFIFVPLDRIVNWEGTAFIHPSILLFSFLALLLLHQDTWKTFVLAVVSAFIASFTLGNGMFVFIAGFLVLFLQKSPHRQRIVIWGVCFTLIAFFYFYAYTSPKGHPSLIQTVLQQPIAFLAYPCVFLGAIFKSLYTTHQYAGPIIGMFTILFTLGLVYFKWKQVKKHPVLLAILALLLFTIGIAALTRAGFGIGQATTRRYQLMQVSFYATLYITCFILFKSYFKNRMVILLVLSLLLYYFRLDDSIKLLQIQQSRLITSLKYYEAGNPDFLLYPRPKTAARLLEKSIEKGQFNLPSSEVLQPHPAFELPLSQATDNGQFKIEELKNTTDLLVVKGWAFLNYQHSTLQQSYLVLQSESDSFMFEMDRNERMDVNKFFNSNYALEHAGFDIVLNKKVMVLPADNYQIGVYIKLMNGQEGLFFTDDFTEF